MNGNAERPDTPATPPSLDVPRIDLATMPARNARNIAVRLTPAGYRALNSGHPWIYADSIDEYSHDGDPGDLAVIFDRRRDFAAVGLYDPTSPIRIRVLQRHRQATIDAAFWHRRLVSALELRQVIVDDPDTTGFRLLNGEGDGSGGLVADLYDRTVVVKIYSAAWQPHLAEVVTAIVDAVSPNAVVLRLSRQLADQQLPPLVDGAVVAGQLESSVVEFREHGLRFAADVVDGPKTGHFFDQREHRRAAARHAKGGTVLDVFSSTGGFALAAAAQGALHVDAIDLSRPALAAVEANFARNADNARVARCSLRTLPGDAFGEMRRLIGSGERYDLVVIDPPSFAHRGRDAPLAQARYTDLAELGARLVSPGGTLVQASCSSRVTPDELRDTVRRGIERTDRRVHHIELAGHAIDHPVRHPEGEYLAVRTVRLD